MLEHDGRQFPLIREHRITLGLSQRQFADLLGVTFQQVYKYERGINGMSAGQLYDIAQGSGTSVEFFFAGIETDECQLLPRQKWLLDVMVSLGEIQDNDQKAAISHLVRSLSRVSRAPVDLTDEEHTAVAAALRKLISEDKFPLAPRLKPLKSGLAKLDPPKPKAALKPPIAGATKASIRRRKRQGRVLP
jgi:transcriptional regulator with XRE-family HTH domain